MGLALAAISLGACRAEPDFDERYEAADKALRERAEALDRALESTPGTMPNADKAPVTAEPAS